jgi:hypothetical protein
VSDVPLVWLHVVDVARPGALEPDHRLYASTPAGGPVVFDRGATADDVVRYWQRAGWLPARP